MKRNAVRIVKTLRRAGFKAYLVGGAVRDILLGKRPKDYDIATDARPADVMGLFDRTVPVGEAFGVVLVCIDHRSYEVATFRKDVGSTDGRHPDQVVFTSEREDAIRRDFTINSLFLDPLDNSVLDFAGGQEDIEKGIVRAIGNPDDRFREDRLRVLRAVRFAVQLDFRIDPATEQAIRKHAVELSGLSWERITAELRQILTNERRVRGVSMLHEFGILRVVLPEVAACAAVDQDPRFHPEGDVLKHTLLTLGYLRKPDFPLALAALLHDAAKPVTMEVTDRIRFHGHAEQGADMADQVCRRLRLSRFEREKTVDLVKKHMHFINLQKMREFKLRTFLEAPHAAAHIELHRADCLASHGKLDNLKFIAAMRRRWSRLPPASTPLLMGRDLLRMGYSEGPYIGRILEALRELQLEGRLDDADEAREHVHRHFPLDEADQDR